MEQSSATGAEYANSFEDDYASTLVNEDSVHGSQDRLIPASAAQAEPSEPSGNPQQPSTNRVPTSIVNLPQNEQILIDRIRQLGLTERGWDLGGKNSQPLSRLERDLIQIPFTTSPPDGLSEFERLVLLRIRTNIADHGIHPQWLVTHEQWAFVNTVRRWRAEQKPKSQSIFKRILSRHE